MLKAQWPLILALLLSLCAGFFIGPTGEFPLNDDWQYARVAKTFADQNAIHVDVPVAPSLVLQSIVGGVTIRSFGFSHFKLRLLSFCFGLFLLFLMDRILNQAKVEARWRFLALANLSLNPLFLHFQWSFMTELYGFAVQLSGLWIWLKSRERKSQLGQILAIAVIATSFWVRQFCVMLIPCLFVADFFLERKNKGFYLRWAASTFISVAIVGTYFYWVKASGNFKPQFAFPLSQLVDPDAGLWLAQTYVFSMYFLFFLAPFLIPFLTKYKELAKRDFWRWGAVVFLLICVGVGHRWTIKGHAGYNPKSAFNQLMPYLGNVITPLGVGPITTTDVYIEESSKLDSPKIFWSIVTLVLFLLLPTLIFLAREIKSKAKLGSEKVWVLIFSSAVLINVLLAVQAYHRAVFDRYYFPSYLGGLLLLSWIGSRAKISPKVWKSALGVQMVMGLWAVLGMHDYFRWNEARWKIVEIADQSGKLAQLDGGYEVNGILHYDGWGNVKPDVRQSCGPKEEFFCARLPFQISWSVPSGATLLNEVEIQSILYRFPTLKLIQKLIPSAP